MSAELLIEAAELAEVGAVTIVFGRLGDQTEREFGIELAAWLRATVQTHVHSADGESINLWTLPGMEYHPALVVARAILGQR